VISKRNSERSLVETGIRLAFSVWRSAFSVPDVVGDLGVTGDLGDLGDLGVTGVSWSDWGLGGAAKPRLKKA
jgi:hypothetical protein